MTCPAVGVAPSLPPPKGLVSGSLPIVAKDVATSAPEIVVTKLVPQLVPTEGWLIDQIYSDFSFITSL